MPLLTPLPAFPLAPAFGGTGYAGGAWTSYTPTLSSQSGALSSATATGAYIQIGKLVFVRIHVTITTNGTAAGSIVAGLPVAAKAGVSQAMFGTEANVTAKTLQGIISGSTVIIRNSTDISYPGGDGYALNMIGLYEAA